MPQKRNIELTCARCGAQFFTTKQQAFDRGARYCSQLCSARGTAPKRVRFGRDNPSYNGGLSQRRRDGRWEIVCRDDTRYLYARGVMAAKLGRLLTADEVVHHINGDPTDDRVGNLMLMTNSEHSKLHNEMRRAAKRAA